VAATLLVQLTVLLVVMAAMYVDLRSESQRRRVFDRLLVDWAGRVPSDSLERFCNEADFVEETATLDPNNDFSVGKKSRTRTEEEMKAFHEEVRGMARSVRERAERTDAEGRPAGAWAPLREGNRILVPYLWLGKYQEARFLRFRVPESDFGSLQAVYLVLVVGALASMGITVLALRLWILAPLDEVARASERVARGDFATPVPVHAAARDEIAAVAAAFNAMMAELGAYRKDLEAQVGSSVRKARSAEKTLVTAQRLAAMGTLAAGIAHDINNPLGGMINAVRALRRDELPPGKREEYLALVEEGLERVGHTVAKVLQFTPHRVAPRPSDLADVSDRALALARHRVEKAGIQVTVEMPAKGLPVFGDPYELQQVVLNLLVNAADAVASSRRGGEGRILLRGEAREAEARLLVQDNGTGMTEEEAARAFDLFYTTKEVGEGTGLGLSIVHSIVESHGGRVELRSRKGEGTTVEVVLPLLR
jgi:signal transduction histidine kinase